MHATPRLTIAALAAVAVTAAGLGVVLGHSDRIIASGFATALAQAPAAAIPERPAFDPAALRLSRHEDTAAITGLLAPNVGDRISITGAGGRVEVLEVVDVAELPMSVTRVEIDGRERRLAVVTSRQTGVPAAEARIVRFIVDSEAPAAHEPAQRPAPARTL